MLTDYPHSLVIVSPAPAAPLRQDHRLFSYRQRFALLRTCFAAELKQGRVILSTLERSLPKPSYTINTLSELSYLCGTKPIVVVGADQARQITDWHRSGELMSAYRFIVFARGKNGAEFDARLKAEFIRDFDEPASATTIRAQLSCLSSDHRYAAAVAALSQ